MYEPRECTVGIRSRVRDRRYARVPIRRVGFSIYGLMWPQENAGRIRNAQTQAETITWLCTAEVLGGRPVGVWWLNYTDGKTSRPR